MTSRFEETPGLSGRARPSLVAGSRPVPGPRMPPGARPTPAATRRTSSVDLRLPAAIGLCAVGYAASLAGVVHLQAVRDPAYAATNASQPTTISTPPQTSQSGLSISSDIPTTIRGLSSDISQLEGQAQTLSSQVQGSSSSGGIQIGPFNFGGSGAPSVQAVTGASGRP